jgi:nitrogen fixation NifU-like protein
MTEEIKQPIIVNNQTNTHYSPRFLDYAKLPTNLRRMNDPTGSAWIKGLCGDTIEIYLTIEADVIVDASFYTEDCDATRVCGEAVTRLAKGITVSRALSFSPHTIIEHCNGLPHNHIHCAILAINTFHKAVADYLLKP